MLRYLDWSPCAVSYLRWLPVSRHRDRRTSEVDSPFQTLPESRQKKQILKTFYKLPVVIVHQQEET